MIFDDLTKKKKQLDAFRPMPSALVRNLDDWFRVELTYTSNAIEGNTLNRRETALVVEKGLTVGGKTLTEHLEATNHAHALDWVREQIDGHPSDLRINHILHLHSIILKGIDDDNAGHFRAVAVRISGSQTILPNPYKVPDLMEEFIKWLQDATDLHPAELAAEAHYRLVSIHPFVDGNGRTARLLMNLILLMHGYPAAIIRKQERLAYIGALEKAQTGGTKDNYYKIIGRAVNRSLGIYLKALSGETQSEPSDNLMKLGALAKAVGETNSTIRHWVKSGLIDIAEVTPSGYQLFAHEMIKRVETINALKAKRYSLSEIKDKLDQDT